MKYYSLITKTITSRANFLFFAVLFSIACACVNAAAQQPDAAKMKSEALKLMSDVKYTEALPILEKLVLITPGDPDVQRNLAFALLGKSKNTSDPATAKQLRAKARAAFVKAKEVGDDSPLVQGMIDTIPADGGAAESFSTQVQVEEFMQKAEAAFASGKMDEALDFYQKAFKLDPKLYHAALFSGDVYAHKDMFAEAEIWYQRAIAIDPNIETAYRYSATPLMKQKKYDQARDRYVEAWITSPYSNFSIQGMVQWGQITGTGLRHPNMDIPEITTGTDGKYNANITVSSDPMDGSLAWGSYVTTREAWRKQKFSKEFPNATTYRHTLKEEADALRSVIVAAKALKPSKLNQQIANLAAMDQDGVLEAFILMAIPDRGIALDHAAYLKTNRDKLRQYVLNYVIEKKK